ncbi:IS1595 family transposase [Azospirillum sp. sgz301742]
MTEDEARAEFRRRRWPDSDGSPICPHCSSERCYELRTRRALRCARCRRNFSETSGTIFHSAKLELRDYLAVIALFVNAHKGISALQVARDVGISHKAAFVLLHKLREAIEDTRSNMRLRGEVEVDGAYYLGHIRPPNAGRQGKRLKRKGQKLCVLTFRQRDGATVVKVVATERSDVVLAAASAHVLPGSTLYADEHRAYDALHARYRTMRINHGWAYSENGASTNVAESFHARMRRGARGQYHRFSRKHLHAYAAEMAYREDRRRVENGSMLEELVEMALSRGKSLTWVGYWRGSV